MQAAHTAGVHKHKTAVKASDNPGRVMVLMFVRVFIIAHLHAFNLSDGKDVRMFFQVCADDLFPQTSLYPKMIKHFVFELYKATLSRFSHSLRQAVSGAGGPVLHTRNT